MYQDKFIPLVDVGELSKQCCEKPIRVKLKYATSKNFVGVPIDGYKTKEIALMTTHAAHALCEVQNFLLQTYGYGLLIYDAYRPLRAVQHIALWSKQPPTEYELERKEKHYPNIQKKELSKKGYVIMNKPSEHCYGNVVDLVLIDKDGKKLDMGVRFDYMDKQSHTTTDAQSIGEKAYKNRQILSEAMQKFEFEPYEKEFWHFSYPIQEVNDPMDIEITTEMKGLGLS